MFALRNRRNPRKAIYTKEHWDARSLSSRETCYPPLFSRYAPLSAAFASPVRTLVCHLRGKPVYAFCEPRLREECWFLRYILGNLTYIIIRMDEPTVLQNSLAHASYTKLSLVFLTRWYGITLKYSRKILRFENHLMPILNRALFESDYFVVPFSF